MDDELTKLTLEMTIMGDEIYSGPDGLYLLRHGKDPSDFDAFAVIDKINIRTMDDTNDFYDVFDAAHECEWDEEIEAVAPANQNAPTSRAVN